MGSRQEAFLQRSRAALRELVEANAVLGVQQAIPPEVFDESSRSHKTELRGRPEQGEGQPDNGADRACGGASDRGARECVRDRNIHVPEAAVVRGNSRSEPTPSQTDKKQPDAFEARVAPAPRPVAKNDGGRARAAPTLRSTTSVGSADKMVPNDHHLVAAREPCVRLPSPARAKDAGADATRRDAHGPKDASGFEFDLETWRRQGQEWRRAWADVALSVCPSLGRRLAAATVT